MGQRKAGGTGSAHVARAAALPLYAMTGKKGVKPRNLNTPSSPSTTGPRSRRASSKTDRTASFHLDSVDSADRWENAFIEAFNARLRDECRNVHQFTPVEDPRAKIEAWRCDHDRRRPRNFARPPDAGL